MGLSTCFLMVAFWYTWFEREPRGTNRQKSPHVGGLQIGVELVLEGSPFRLVLKGRQEEVYVATVSQKPI